MRPSFHGNWSEVFGLGKWMGGMAIGELYLQQGDLLILGALVTPVQLAPYIAAKTLFRVYALLSQAVNFLVIASAPRHGMEGTMDKLRTKLKGILVLMWLILIPVNVFLFFTAESLLPGILGNEYIAVVPFFMVLMLATFFEPFYSVTATALLGLGRPKNVAGLFWGLIAGNVLANVILVYQFGLTPAPWILVGTYVCLGLGMLYSGWRQLQ
jgi:O-antigen/teichoic acid export membrane protein